MCPLVGYIGLNTIVCINKATLSTVPVCIHFFMATCTNLSLLLIHANNVGVWFVRRWFLIMITSHPTLLVGIPKYNHVYYTCPNSIYSNSTMSCSDHVYYTCPNSTVLYMYCQTNNYHHGNKCNDDQRNILLQHKTLYLVVSVINAT